MALLKKIADAATGKKKNKFFSELKDWVISPGGIVTIVLFVSAMIYIHHATSKKKA